MKWGVPGLAALILSSCTVAGPRDPVNERLVKPDGSGWSAPEHQCSAGTSHTMVEDDGSVVQSCQDGAKLEGRYVKWHANGQKAVEGQYEEGKRSGTWAWWHENGRISARGEFRRDDEIGRWTWYHANGRKQTEGDHLDGMRAGMWTTWYATGAKQSEGQYRADEKDGTWRYWLADGTPEKEEVWEIGLLKKERILKGGRQK